jgi:hypothetical protein
MLLRIRDLILRPRSGAVALGAVAVLSFPVAASAAPATATYTNSATAASQTNGRNVFILKYQAEETAASTLNAKNQALASTTQCRNCDASGVAFQVIFVSKGNALTINADNEANATSTSCVNCQVLAAAYQIIYAADQPGLSRYQVQGLNHVHSELIALQFTGLTGAKLQARTDAIAQEAVGVLNDGPNPIPVVTPAINKSGTVAPSQLTENNGPFIDLMIKSQHQGS